MTDAQQGAAIIFTGIGIFVGWFALIIGWRFLSLVWDITFGWYFEAKEKERLDNEWREQRRLQAEREREWREQNPEEYAAQEAEREAARAAYVAQAPDNASNAATTTPEAPPPASNDFRPHTVRYADGSTRTVWSEADAKALMTWGGATSYKGAGDLFETHRVNPFFKNPFLDD